MGTSIIIPAHNEEKRIGKTLEAYSEYFERLRKDKVLDYEIIVSINNTTDKTEEIVRRAQKNNSRIRFLNFKQGGKGFAVVEGFKEALKRDSDLIGFVDADMATSPEEYYKLIRAVRGYDGVIASRNKPGSKIKTTISRKIMNRGYNLIVRLVLMLKFRDTQCGAKIFKRYIIQELLKDKIMTQWAFDVDILYKLRNKNIIEVATAWEDKEGSKINLITPIKMFLSIIRLRILYSPFNFIAKIYEKLPGILKIHKL